MGASQAACACASALRRLGFEGAITMVGEESHPPYVRPPLSKGVLIGAEPDESVFLPTPEGIDVIAGVRATRLDLSKRLVELSDGDRLSYDGLVVATGARARRLAPADRTGEIMLRGLDDAVSLRKRLAAVRDVVVAGGGFLGMEIASSAVRLGKSVTVVDQVMPLTSRLGPLLAGMLHAAAADHGVRVRVVRAGIGLGFGDGVPDRLVSPDGTSVAEGDIAVTAAGDVPNTEWLRGSGLLLTGGTDGALVTGEDCLAAPGVVAAGDVVAVRGAGRRPVRTPHWSNALSQAETAAATLLDREAGAAAIAPSFFWTEAFGLKIRLAGELPPRGEPTVLDGSVAERRVLLHWPAGPDGGGTAAAVNLPVSAPKLSRIARQRPAPTATLS
ncbi:FAD-dependent oxidoreductase [Streptomyces sp. NPDC047072]|uniref:NAD(P)/FAD-dependent oxidoreductase n=1 Tax=Streptomyces sp. NPDC047072 TaxID=3154809 RepID=UPI0033D4B70E